MRIVAWNMAHQTRDCAIAGGFWDALAFWTPDIVSLNEYVHGQHGPASEERFRDAGLPHVLVSQRQGRHNQVLIASRHPLVPGDLMGPDIGDGAGRSNFLHVRVPSRDFELAGMRCPAYPSRRELTDYWTRLEALIISQRDRRIIFAGDFNANPEQPRYPGAASLQRLLDTGWHMPKPGGPWSFVGGTHIDHAVISSVLTPLPSASYVSELDGRAIASRDRATRVSDHAALVLDFPPQES